MRGIKKKVRPSVSLKQIEIKYSLKKYEDVKNRQIKKSRYVEHTYLQIHTDIPKRFVPWGIKALFNS